MSVLYDLHYSFRKLNNNLAFTAVAVLCLALGIGAGVTVFSVFNALLLRPVPGVTEADHLVSVTTQPVLLPGIAGEEFTRGLSYVDFLRYRDDSRGVLELAAFHPVFLNLFVSGEPLRVDGQMVSDNYFETLGLKSSLGRLFSRGEARRESQLEVVVSHSLWRRSLGRRADVLRAPLILNGREFTVIGVAPEGFRGSLRSGRVDVWVLVEAAPLIVPLLGESALEDRDREWLHTLFGRLAPGMDLERAQPEMDRLARQLAEPGAEGHRPAALKLYPGIGIAPGLRPALVKTLPLLAVAVALLMLVVCANLGGLLLVKAAARQEEIGVRLALGVSRRRLVRQLLTESVTLSAIGGSAGFLLALAATELLRGVALGRFMPRLAELPLDGRVLAFTVALSLVTGVGFGLVPALWASRSRAEPVLRQGSGASKDRGRVRLQEIFVVGQVTVSLVLLITTGLFVRTLKNLQSVDPGFDSEGVVNLRLDLDTLRYDPVNGRSFHDRLLEQIRAMHGVRSASLAFAVPLGGGAAREGRITSISPLQGSVESSEPVFIESNAVSPGYFRTLGIPLVRGRDFTAADREGAPGVVIVNEAFAAMLRRGNLVGERLNLGQNLYEVVGLAGDVRPSDLRGDPVPLLYRPLSQGYEPSVTLQIKTTGEPAAVIEPVRALMAKMDPQIPLFQVSLYRDEVRETLAQPRLLSWLFGSFSLIAILVTAIGLYGTLAFTVRRRTRELGIRMALGARVSEIVSLVFRRGITLTMIGLMLGLGAAIWTTSLFASHLFGVTPTDPAVFLLVALLLTLVGLAASSLPAYSATRVDPMAVIRHE